ncbi:MAG: amidohydrolase family protein [Oscillospiraceae bacterium]
MPLFDYKTVDRDCYEAVIRDFLPQRIVDAHTHVYRGCFRLAREAEGVDRSQNWPNLVAEENPIEDLLETYRILLPDKAVTPLIFGQPSLDYDVGRNNRYIADCGKEYGFPALYLSRPEESAEELEKQLEESGFQGVKVYLNFSPPYIPADEIRIFDFLPHHQLELLDARGAVVMLHIPRPGRLRDPVNLAQMLEIDRRYPRIRLIIAHVGRAYAEEDLGDALERLADSHMWMDFCANTNQQVFEAAIRHLGPKRLLFGSDLPILRMRMRRIVENGSYINVVPRGLYGDVSGDAHMREVDGGEAEGLTFFFYEEIAAMRRAAENMQLDRGDIEKMFCGNAVGLLGLVE